MLFIRSTHFLLLENPRFNNGFTPVLLINYPVYLSLEPVYLSLDPSDVSFLLVSLISFVFVYKNPLESFTNPVVLCIISFANPVVLCNVFNFLPLSILSFLTCNFLFEPGRLFISGKNDYDDFIKD